METCARKLSDIDITESPRFDYRGIRYFAHRSLHRFQAEHWSLEDWQREIDWMLKKRLNCFMLRIGVDDLFQKAFPEAVPYPERDMPLPEAGEGYDDRTLFWSLEYRGELRKNILKYAFERDIIHPEDCGTISHWYSRTPLAFLENVKPALLPQSNGIYSEPTGRVWDIRDKENFKNYFNLTETHIREYGKAEVFHTIGLGERLYSSDPEKNKRMKLFVYRMICNEIMEKHANSPLWIASWDLWMHFKPEEVKDLVKELDTTRTVIFDYTSDTVRKNNFREWGIVGKFPWIFGVFSGYEPNSEIRGYYKHTNDMLKIAKADPMCRGMVLWPELSHGDPFVIEYLANNAWECETLEIEDQTDKYCRDRYPAKLVDDMRAIWHKFMPVVSLTSWSVDDSYQQRGNDIFPLIIERADFKPQRAAEYLARAKAALEIKKSACEILKMLASIPLEDELTKRDAYDIARTVIGRYINTAILVCEYFYACGKPIEMLERNMDIALGLEECMVELLGSHYDYSLYSSLIKLCNVTDTNPNFEKTLKENASCSYCRSYIYENAKHLYLPEMKLLFEEIKNAAKDKREPSRQAILSEQKNNTKRFFDVPLSDMQGGKAAFEDTVKRAADIISVLFSI